jgi:hypothetical protein
MVVAPVGGLSQAKPFAKGSAQLSVERFVSTNGAMIFSMRYPHCPVSMRVAQFFGIGIINMYLLTAKNEASGQFSTFLWV